MGYRGDPDITFESSKMSAVIANSNVFRSTTVRRVQVMPCREAAFANRSPSDRPRNRSWLEGDSTINR
jgi:hypothetical protein